MAWEIIEENQETSSPSGRYVIEDPKEDSSVGRALGIRARGAISGLGEFGALADTLGLQAKEELPGVLARRDMEQDTLSKLTKQEGYVPSIGELDMLSDGDDVLPNYSRLINPEEIQESLDTATEGKFIPRTESEQRTSDRYKSGVGFSTLTPWAIPASFAQGYLFEGGTQVGEQAGLGGVGQFVTGVATSSLPSLIKASIRGVKSGVSLLKDVFSSNKLSEIEPKFLKEVGSKSALADVELSHKSLLNRTAKMSEEQLSKLQDLRPKGEVSSLGEIKDFNASEIEKSLILSNQKTLLNKLAPEARTQKEAWKNVGNFVEKNFEEAQNQYKTMYDAVESGSKDLGVIPRETTRVAKNISDSLEESLLKISEEAPIRSTINDLLKQLEPMTQGNLVELPMNKIMATKRSVNRLISRSKQALDVIPNANDLLFPIAKSLKLDITEALGAKPGLQNLYKNAENLFAETQNVFNNDSVLKLRRASSPEELSSFFSRPSNLQKLKPSLGGNKDVNKYVDRMVIEDVAKKGTESSQESLRELKDFLTPEAAKLGDELLEYGNKLTSRGQQALTRRAILEDLQKSYTTGSRPDYIYKQMMTKEGLNLVNRTLSASPKGNRALNILKNQFVDETIGSVLENGKINYSKTSNLIANPQTEKIFLDIVGKDGTEVLKKMSIYGKNLNANLALFAEKNPSIWKQIIEKQLPKGTIPLLSALSIAKPFVGLPSIGALVAKEGISALNKARLLRVLKNPKAVTAFKQLATQKTMSSPGLISSLLKTIGEAATSDEKED